MAMEGDVREISNITNSKKMFGMESAEVVTKAVSDYEQLFKQNNEEEVQRRKNNYEQLVNSFYDLVTEFYMFGWGQSFHFAPRHQLETFESSIARHEMWAAFRLELREGKKALDMGCGVGGPMRTIARFSKAHVTGLNNNAFQVEKANKLNFELNLAHLCTAQKGDFMNMSQFADGTFDAAYHIEALCHAPDKKKVYREIFRVLKPGGMFLGYQWNVTPKYKKENPEHLKLKQGIEVGNGVAELDTFETELEAIQAAGFEVVEATDLALDSEIPWYEPLAGQFSITGFKHTYAGRILTNKFVYAMESCKLAPTGTLKVHTLLCETADDLVNAGRLGIFTPMFLTLIRKPATASS